MRRAEKRKKLHDALLKSLYPQSPEAKVHNDGELPPPTSAEEFDVNLIPDDYGLQTSGSPSTSDGDGEEDGSTQKLTRAQRKRLRKKKIKEDACRRKGIIGPLLPAGDAECSPGVRRNAEERIESCNPSEESQHASATNARSVNQRRKAKKLAKEKSRDCAAPEEASLDSTHDQMTELEK